MLSPGSASALVNTALEWLQPQVIQALTSSLLDSGADPNEGSARQGRAAAATTPGPLCSALAAVLQFLRAHIQARQVRLHACCSHYSIRMHDELGTDLFFPTAACPVHHHLLMR